VVVNITLSFNCLFFCNGRGLSSTTVKASACWAAHMPVVNDRFHSAAKVDSKVVKTQLSVSVEMAHAEFTC
jgi:hypothetical protein